MHVQYLSVCPCDRRTSLEQIYELLALLQPDGTVLEVNQSALNFIGSELSSVVGCLFWETPWWKNSAQLQTRLKDAIAWARTGEEVRYQVQHASPSKTILTFDFSIKPVKNSAGEVQFLIASASNQSEEQLHTTEARLRYLLNASPSVTYSCQPYGDYAITFISDNITSILGYSSHEFLLDAKFWVDHIHPEDATQIFAAHTHLFEQGHYTFEYRFQHKNGDYRWIRDECQLIRDASGEPLEIVGYWIDISEKKQLEAQFLRTQRLENLGILASGIAHDLNNILTPILAIAQLLPLTLSNLDERNQHMLKILETNTKRGADLVKQILSFARGAESKRALVQVKHLLLDIEHVVKATFPKSIEIERQVSDNLMPVEADPTQLHQVFMNLAVNARDAMPEGGNMTITAENKFIDENYAKMNVEATVGHYVAVTFADTGIGIPHHNISQIFDPFFTTKETSQGTGLGLSTVLGIVKNHGGFVEVYSELGKGSSFKIYLPASSNPPKPTVSNLDLPRGNAELILFVDDEPAIAETSKNTLEAYNYRVLVANSGIEALAVYAQHKYEIDVVLMDLIMPSLDGETTIRALKKMNPEVQIIAMSGSNLNADNLKVESYDVRSFLSKPFTANQLLNAVYQITAPATRSR